MESDKNHQGWLSHRTRDPDGVRDLGKPLSSRCRCISLIECYLVVSNIFHVHPYLGKISHLTHIFQMGWNHQLVNGIRTYFFEFLAISYSKKKHQRGIYYIYLGGLFWKKCFFFIYGVLEKLIVESCEVSHFHGPKFRCKVVGPEVTLHKTNKSPWF